MPPLRLGAAQLLVLAGLVGPGCATDSSAGQDARAGQDAAGESVAEGGVDGGPAPDGATELAGDATDDGVPMCSADWSPEAACDSCIEDKCCAEAAECLGTKDCLTLFKCLHACSATGTCFMDCLTKYPDGTGASSKLDGCLYSKCPPGCRSGS